MQADKEKNRPIASNEMMDEDKYDTAYVYDYTSEDSNTN